MDALLFVAEKSGSYPSQRCQPGKNIFGSVTFSDGERRPERIHQKHMKLIFYLLLAALFLTPPKKEKPAPEDPSTVSVRKKTKSGHMKRSISPMRLLMPFRFY